jgi:Reverse transcriptase (RNA-dependent DNA polymerase)
MTRSTTQEAVAAFGLGIAHHVFSAKAAKPNDAMDPGVRVKAINKEVRGLFNRGAFSLVHVDAVPSHANIIATRIILRLKHFGTADEEAKARLIIQRCQDAEKNRIVSNAPTVFYASISILNSFAAIKDYPVWTKKATKAFLQSKDTLLRNLYARLPLELRSVFNGYILKMLKSLYGTKEAGKTGTQLIQEMGRKKWRYFVHAGSMFYDCNMQSSKRRSSWNRRHSCG